MTIAIHTVFIAKENILFLSEWIAYHIIKGVDVFYLYDNTGVELISSWDKEHIGNNMVPNKINKYGYNYKENINMTDEEVTETLELIKLQFKPGVVNIIKWQPKEIIKTKIYSPITQKFITQTINTGKIKYSQIDAQKDVIKRFANKIDWLIYIDTDEYIVSKLSIPELITKIDNDGYSACGLKQIRCITRFKIFDKLIIESNIGNNEIVNHSLKHIYKIKDTNSDKLDVHKWVGKSNAKLLNINEDDAFYYHYNNFTFSEDMTYNNLIDSSIISEVKEYLKDIGNPEWRKKYLK